jgi:hypothetical protein
MVALVPFLAQECGQISELPRRIVEQPFSWRRDSGIETYSS